MITGAIKNQIDQIWNAFWSGGISNPLEVIEQITYLLILRRLDDLHTLEETKSARFGEPISRRCFLTARTRGAVPFEDLSDKLRVEPYERLRAERSLALAGFLAGKTLGANQIGSGAAHRSQRKTQRA